MPKLPIEYLKHIRDELTYLIETSADVEEEIFMRDPTLQRAFSRSISIIGEAVKTTSLGYKPSVLRVFYIQCRNWKKEQPSLRPALYPGAVVSNLIWCLRRFQEIKPRQQLQSEPMAECNQLLLVYLWFRQLFQLAYHQL